MADFMRMAADGGGKVGGEPSGAKDDPATTKDSAKTAELEKEKVNPSAPGNTGTTPGSNADVG
jgi:hypothetical protein